MSGKSAQFNVAIAPVAARGPYHRRDRARADALKRRAWWMFLCATVAASASAAVPAPVLKWAYGGCFSSGCQTGWYSSPVVVDLDGDGGREIVSGSYDVVALAGAGGSLKWRAASGGRVWPGIAIGDLAHDGRFGIAVGRSAAQVRGLRRQWRRARRRAGVAFNERIFADGFGGTGG